jgi:hypothetical protein
MFQNCYNFNQPLNKWNINKKKRTNMFDGIPKKNNLLIYPNDVYY